MKDETYYDDETLVRAKAALTTWTDMDADQASEAISALLNGNILLRDRYEGGKP